MANSNHVRDQRRGVRCPAKNNPFASSYTPQWSQTRPAQLIHPDLSPPTLCLVHSTHPPKHVRSAAFARRRGGPLQLPNVKASNLGRGRTGDRDMTDRRIPGRSTQCLVSFFNLGLEPRQHPATVTCPCCLDGLSTRFGEVPTTLRKKAS